MKAEIGIDEIVVDDIDIIKKELQKGENFKLSIYNDYNNIEFCLEHIDGSVPCSIMFSVTKEEALLFGKALVTLSEYI